MQELRKNGKTLGEIGNLYGISRERVRQITNNIKNNYRRKDDARKFKINHIRIAMFWERVDIRCKDDCWNWQGALNQNGYGAVTINGKHLSPHRVAYSFFNGDIPDELFVCHHCDNRRCCNPFHLFLGTHTDNMRDMINKGRAPNHKGERCGAAKLTNEQVIAIRHSKKTQMVLSEEFGISGAQVSRIKSGINWSHIT
jgi:hypothetical protein